MKHQEPLQFSGIALHALRHWLNNDCILLPDFQVFDLLQEAFEAFGEAFEAEAFGVSLALW